MLKEYIEKLIERLDLTLEEAKEAVDILLKGADPHQAAAMLVLLRSKGESPEELAGMVTAMREHAISVEVEDPLLDIVGTGGDNFGTVNISTGAAILAAAAGAKVAKHGNRSVSSKCGSADILEKMGVAIELEPKDIATCIHEVGIGFMYAPAYHPALQLLAPIRKSLKVRTSVNILGPLLNPARAEYSLIGVFDENLLDLMAQTLFQLGTRRSLIVHSMGLDELTLAAPTDARLVLEDEVRDEVIDPIDYGLPRAPLEALKGGDPDTNYTLLMKAFEGEDFPISDALILNAGVALNIYGHAKDIQEGIDQAKEALYTKQALETLHKWVELSNRLKKEEK